jgi:glycosyltransferase involved in cell wall biosynthesis
VHHRSELGGAPASLSYLITQLLGAGFEPHIYCPPGPVTELFTEAGATVHNGPVAGFTHIWASSYRGRRWVLFARELLLLPHHLRRMDSLLRSVPFELVHLNDSPLIPAAWLARRRGLPVVWHLRSALADEDGLRTRLIRAAVRRFSSAAIAINDDVAHSFRVDAHVIPNAVRLDHFRPGDSRAAKEALGLPLDRPIAAYFGFIYPSKGYRDFIEAASLLRARGTHATFIMVGGPVRGEEFFATLKGRLIERLGLARNYEAEVRKLVQRLGLDDIVISYSFTRDPALLYRASDVVVSPSRGMELGRPVIEASACGRAIIATGSLSGAGIVEPGETGLLVPQRSPDVLAAALEQLLADQELRLRLGENARRHAEENFDASRNAERVIDVYAGVLEDRE